MSLFLLAAGAILAFAVDVETEGVNLDVIGWILIAIGGLGFLFTLLLTSELFARTDRRDRVVREERYQ